MQWLFVLPLLLILLFAVIEFGFILQVQQTLTAAAEAGVRVAARGGTTNDVVDAINGVLAIHNLEIASTTTDAAIRIEASGGAPVDITAIVCESPGPALPVAPLEHRVTVCLALRPTGAASAWQKGVLPDLLASWGFALADHMLIAGALAPTE